MDWTGIASMDTWFPYWWENGEMLELPEGRTKPLFNRRFESIAPLTPLTGGKLSTSAVRFVLYRHLFDEDGRAGIFCHDRALGSTSAAHCSKIRDDGAAPYFED